MAPAVVRGYENLVVPDTGTLIAIGNFDGVHLGHRALVQHALAEARARGLMPLVMTFDPHPAVVLTGASPTLLTTTERKVALLGEISSDLQILVQPFTASFSQIEAEDFVQEILITRLKARYIVVGKNFHFGRARRGNHELLRELAKRMPFVAQPFELSGDLQGTYSSSRARSELKHGRLGELAQVLGRPHAISGKVVTGQRLGRQLGFPTANLEEITEGLPPAGVYTCIVDELKPAADRLALGVMSIGPRPTVSLGYTVEIHLLDFSGDLYGKRLRVHLIEHLRGIEKFDSVQELKAHIAADVEQARRQLAAWQSANHAPLV